MSCCIGGQTHCFADDGEPAPTPAGRQGVLEGELGFVFEQAARHHEMAGYPFSAGFLEVADLRPGDPIQFGTGHVLVNVG